MRQHLIRLELPARRLSILPSRSLFLDAVISGSEQSDLLPECRYGRDQPGWPVDVNATVSGFSSIRPKRTGRARHRGLHRLCPIRRIFWRLPALIAAVLVGVQMNNPASVMGPLPRHRHGPGYGGLAASPATAPICLLPPVTAPAGATWSGSEAVIRLQPGPVFSGSTTDYWAPTNWASLDSSDTDLGGSGPILVDVPGATPSALVVALGKDGNAYLLNRNNLGGVSAPVSQSCGWRHHHSGGGNLPDRLGTYVVFRRQQQRNQALSALPPPIRRRIATGGRLPVRAGAARPLSLPLMAPIT